MTRTRLVPLCAVAVLAIPATLGAQLPASSTRAIGMGNGYTASAKGYEAIAWNPALLAAPGRPRASFNLVQVSTRMGSNSFGLRDFTRYDGTFLTSADKDTILDLIRQGTTDRPLTFDVDAGATGFALQLGNFAASVSAGAAVGAGISSDAVELLLFGNVTRKGPGQVFRATGTQIHAWGAGTAAFAYGSRIPVPIGALSVGATLKLNQGIVVARAEDLPGTLGTTLQTQPNFSAQLGAHALMSDLDNSTANGSGVGLDLGGMYELASGLRFGLVFENLLNKTSWKDDNLVYYQKRFRLTQTGDQLVDTTLADIQEAPYNAADPLQKTLHDSMVRGTFPTRIRAGVNFATGPLTFAGGVTLRANSVFESGAAQNVNAGVELRVIPFLPLRAGVSSDFVNGMTFAAGAGLKLGPVRLDAALANTPTGDHKGFQLAFGLGFMR